MDFYSTWENTRALQVKDVEFMKEFLICAKPSLDTLIDGKKEDIQKAVEVIKNIPYCEFIEGIKATDNKGVLIAAEVPCFSTFSNGAVRLNELLEFAPEGLTYAEIGYQMTQAPSQLAQIKYGENHSKLAAMMSLVTIDASHRPATVTASALGHCLTMLSFDDKKQVLQKLILRDRCVRKIVYEALVGEISYKTIVRNLKDSTAYRRRTSVKCVVDFALDNPDAIFIKEKINWEL